LDQLVATSELTRRQIIEALEEADKEGILEFNTEGVQNRLKRHKVLSNTEMLTLADNLYHGSFEKQEREIERLNMVLEMISTKCCRYIFLSKHFGRQLMQDCGHCDWCLYKSSVTINRLKPIQLETSLCQKSFQACWNKGVKDATAITKFALGISSPLLTKSGLFTSHPYFGYLQEYGFTFSTVLEAAQDFVRNPPKPSSDIDVACVHTMNVQELKQALSSRKLPISGKKADLVDRLKKHLTVQLKFTKPN